MKQFRYSFYVCKRQQTQRRCAQCGKHLLVGDKIYRLTRINSEEYNQKVLEYQCEDCFKLTGREVGHIFPRKIKKKIPKPKVKEIPKPKVYDIRKLKKKIQEKKIHQRIPERCPDCGSKLVNHNPNNNKLECINPKCHVIEIRLSRAGNHTIRESVWGFA